MKPQARKDQLLVQEVSDELVVFDERTNEAHRLNRTAAMVWRLADGQRSVAEIGSIVGDTLEVGDADELVNLSFAELERAGLILPGGLSAFNVGEIMTRRQMLNVAASLLPLVVSIIAPTPAMADHSFFHNILTSSSSSSSSSSSLVLTGSSSSSGGTTSSSSSSASAPSSSSSSTSSSSSSSTNVFTARNGQYVGTGKVSENTCGFDAEAELRAALTLNSGGAGSWSKTHVRPNITFGFPNAQAKEAGPQSITYTTSGTFTIAGVQYTVTDVITITGNNMTGTQTFERAGCRVVYQLTLTKSA